MTTQEEFEKVMAICREVFVKKMHDYGTAWRILRTTSLTDQSEDLQGHALISEGVAATYLDMRNYSAFALIKLVVEGEDEKQA